MDMDKHELKPSMFIRGLLRIYGIDALVYDNRKTLPMSINNILRNYYNVLLNNFKLITLNLSIVVVKCISQSYRLILYK